MYRSYGNLAEENNIFEKKGLKATTSLFRKNLRYATSEVHHFAVIYNTLFFT